jgi:hypothetical protein
VFCRQNPSAAVFGFFVSIFSPFVFLMLFFLLGDDVSLSSLLLFLAGLIERWFSGALGTCLFKTMERRTKKEKRVFVFSTASVSKESTVPAEKCCRVLFLLVLPRWLL